MNLVEFWSQFNPAERKGIKLTLALLVAFVAGCTAWGGAATGQWKAAADAFVASVGAFGQLSIAAGLWLLTRHQLVEARKVNQTADRALEQAREAAEREEARHKEDLAAAAARDAREEDRTESRERRKEFEEGSREVNRLDDLCGVLLAANGDGFGASDTEQLRETCRDLESRPRFAPLAADLTMLREVGLRFSSDKRRPQDRFILIKTRRKVVDGLRRLNDPR